VDFETNGQIDADIIHRYLVSQLPNTAQLHAIFDCCHSGSAMELPYVYRTDDDGNVNLVDNIKQGLQLATSAATLLAGGFTISKVQDAEQLYAGASSFFKSLQHRGGEGEEGLAESESTESHEYTKGENKRVFLFSGCMLFAFVRIVLIVCPGRDDQTSADANIAGAHVGVSVVFAAP
jgi:metacaspase-1